MFGLDPWHLALAFLFTGLAGFVKGAVGFGAPMVMIASFASFLPPTQALAALILPTVVTNVFQAFRNGLDAARASVRRFRVYLGIVVLFILCSAQLVRILPAEVMLLLLGVPILLFTITQLAGWSFHIAPEHRFGAEVGIGIFAGTVGGFSGVWGPPTVLYLNAIDVPKAEHMRVQGVIYGVGALALLAAHLRSGVLNASTAPLSLALILPALAGQALGYAVHDRLDQRRFRQATLVVLTLAALNLIRRGLS